MPSDFETLQRAIRAASSTRQAEGRVCEAFLSALYQAFRHANGPGLPLNNVTLELSEDPSNRLQPVPLGGWHAAWLRLGLCEVYLRVRREGQRFLGEYGPRGQFVQEGIGEDDLLVLARHIMRELSREQGAGDVERGEVN